MATREQAKSQRKSDILDSARALLRQAQGHGFSMRALADAAGVSSATPYNLFGSKQAILVALLDADLEQYQSALAALEADGIDLMFEAVALMQRFLAGEPEFYRGVMGEMSQDGGAQLRYVVGGPRYALWKHMLAQAADAGLLQRELDPDAFAITVTQMIAGNLQEWALGQLSLPEMDARIRYGLSLCLLAIATDTSRVVLSRRWQQAEHDLQQLWRSILQERLQHGAIDDQTRELLADQLRYLQLQQTGEQASKQSEHA